MDLEESSKETALFEELEVYQSFLRSCILDGKLKALGQRAESSCTTIMKMVAELCDEARTRSFDHTEAKVFIAHSGEEKSVYKPLQDLLQTNMDCETFLDHWSIEYGPNAEEEILQHALRCKVGLVVCSKAFLTRSTFTLFEMFIFCERVQRNEDFVLVVDFYSRVELHEWIDYVMSLPLPKEMKTKRGVRHEHVEDHDHVTKETYPAVVQALDHALAEARDCMFDAKLLSHLKQGYSRLEIDLDLLADDDGTTSRVSFDNAASPPVAIFRGSPGENIDIEEFVRRKRQVILWGKAGSGKSSLCRRLAWNWAMRRSHFSAVVLVDLKQATVSARKAGIIDIEDLLLVHFQNLRLLEEGASLEELRKLLDGSNNLLLILDGLDEGKESLNVDEIVRSASWARNTAVLLTCRPGEINSVSGWGQLEVAGFRDPYYVIDICFGLMQKEKEHTLLKEIIERNSVVRDLVRVPLQAQLMCAVFSEFSEEETHPSCVPELFARATSIFLVRGVAESKRYATATANEETEAESISSWLASLIVSRTSPSKGALRTGVLWQESVRTRFVIGVSRASETFQLKWYHESFEQFFLALGLFNTLNENANLASSSEACLFLLSVVSDRAVSLFAWQVLVWFGRTDSKLRGAALAAMLLCIAPTAIFWAQLLKQPEVSKWREVLRDFIAAAESFDRKLELLVNWTSLEALEGEFKLADEKARECLGLLSKHAISNHMASFIRASANRVVGLYILAPVSERMEYLKQSQKILEEVSGSVFELGLTLRSKAQLLLDSGMYEKALAECARSVDCFEERNPAFFAERWLSQALHARIDLELRGLNSNAVLIMQDCKIQLKRAVGERHAIFADILEHSGWFNLRGSLPSEALQDLILCKEIRQELHPSNTRLLAKVERALGGCYIDLGEFDKALVCLKFCENTFRKEDFELTLTWDGLCQVHLALFDRKTKESGAIALSYSSEIITVLKDSLLSKDFGRQKVYFRALRVRGILARHKADLKECLIFWRNQDRRNVEVAVQLFLVVRDLEPDTKLLSERRDCLKMLNELTGIHGALREHVKLKEQIDLLRKNLKKRF